MITEETVNLIKKMRQYEKEGRFDEHLNPIDESIILPVGEDFPYVHKPLRLRILYFLYRHTIVDGYAFYINHIKYKTIIKGRENLDGIQNAIVTCNHVNIWDCLTIRKALKGHRVYFTAAEFNNRRGFLGEMMRACRLMPIAKESRSMKAFIHAVRELLADKRGNYIVFYPEQAMWWNYKKPRPLKDGAFHFAAKAGVPVVPLFITFRQKRRSNAGEKTTECALTEEQDALERDTALFTVNILPPIYPDGNLSARQNTINMQQENERRWKTVYQDTYFSSTDAQ